MKNDFKKWLAQHKGKVLDKDLIDCIAQRYEDEIGSMLYDEGLCLESMDTGKNIIYGSCDKDDTNWSVQSSWETEKEFITLRRAIDFANRR